MISITEQLLIYKANEYTNFNRYKKVCEHNSKLLALKMSMNINE